MKKTLSLILAIALCLGCLGLTAAAAEGTTVFVSISSAGQLVAARQPVTVSDSDGDGALTISDALYCAHEALYTGGAAAGYKSSVSDYGISLDMLWGVENGGSYGYYVNYASAMSLSDPISDGDSIYAYSYADLEGWSDVYTHFKGDEAQLAAGQSVTVYLVSEGYDESWNPVTTPAAGAEIFIDGEATEYVTDADGSVTITFDKAGTYLVTARSEVLNITPALCLVSVRSFADTVAAQYADEIEAVYAAGLMKGTDKGFEPMGELSRAMLVTVLYRLEGSPEGDFVSDFSDVEAGSWYEKAVAWAAEKAIVNGFGDGSFAPAESITRQQLAAVMYRYAGFKGLDVSADGEIDFADMEQVSPWALTAVRWAAAKGLMTAEGSKLTPTAPALREQAAMMLARFIEK